MVASDKMPPKNALHRTIRCAGRRCTGSVSRLCEARKRTDILRLRGSP